MRSFKHLDKEFTGRSLANVDGNAISAYMAKRLIDEKAMPATVNREYSTLSKAVSLAVKPWHWMKYNPCREISKYDERNIKAMWLDNRQEDILTGMAKDFLNGDFPDMVIVSIHTGMREHEILDLKAAQVNRSNRTVTALKTNNNEPRTIPLNKTAYQVFAQRLEGLNGSAYAFSDSHGGRYQPAGFKKS
jgi:site-specific recombinase XerD